MFSIYADKEMIYSDVFAVDRRKILEPKLTLEVGAAGSLTFTMPPDHFFYNELQLLATNITVYRENDWIWEGRILSEEVDYWNCKRLTCEGALAFLNDTIQPQKEYTGVGIRRFLEQLLEIHNSKVDANRQFEVGTVTVRTDDLVNRTTDNISTMEALQDLVNDYGGYVMIHRDREKLILDYLAKGFNTSEQIIQFGENLVDFTRNQDASDFITVIIPLGAKLEGDTAEGAPDSFDVYTTVESVNDGKMYVANEDAYNTFGWIESVVTWDEITEPAELLAKAQQYLSDLQFDEIELELSAVDLHYLDVDTAGINLLDNVRVISRPHGMDRQFLVSKIEIPLDSPENSMFYLGGTLKSGLAAQTNRENAALRDQVNKLPKKHTLLKEAQENANALMHQSLTGYITITQDEYGSDTLYISDTRDYTAAQKLWKWSMAGLGYSNDGGTHYGLAITMDGAIVADYITAGILSGDRVRTGVIVDEQGNVTFDLTNGTLTMKKGSINIGDNFLVDEEGHVTIKKGSINLGDNFLVTSDGNVTIKKGSINIGDNFLVDEEGNLTAESGIFRGIVQAEAFKDQGGSDMMENGKFTSEYLDVRGLNVNNKFLIDEDGNVTIKGGSISWSIVDGHEALDSEIDGLGSEIDSLGREIDGAYSAASDAEELARKIANGTYSNGTFISGTEIYSPTIYADDFAVQPKSKTDGSGGLSIYGYWDSSLHQMMHIYYYEGVPPAVVFTGWSTARWTFDTTHFAGSLVDFRETTVVGINATWK